MSKEKVKHISDKQRERDSRDISEAIRRARQHIRNIDSDEINEPDGLVSGDMKKILDDPDPYEDDTGDEHGK
ncbi:hypothetical protein ACNKU7_01950 [Microbulbifer sp. SA54]|uniref:hypothetical protein n=1 Tax=Microbulbifer sp. SA54 TaxID=3401577 RepID=UPI003AB016A0